MSTGVVPPLAPTQRYIVLSGLGLAIPSPGVAKVKGAGSPRNWDIRAGYGLSGASVFFTGAGISKFDVDIFVWENEHWALWEAFSTLLTSPPPPPGVFPASFGIGHPILNAKPWLITKVVVEDISSWEVNDTGLWATTIKFIEYRKAKPGGLSPLEGPPGTQTAPVPLTAQQKANAALDAENAQLRAKAGAGP